MNEGISVRVRLIICLSMVLSVASILCGCQGKTGQSKSPATVVEHMIGPFKVSVMKGTALSALQVSDINSWLLSAGVYRTYNFVLVLQVINTAPDAAVLDDKQFVVQVADDTSARHEALGYVLGVIDQAGKNDSLHTLTLSRPQTTITYSQHHSDGQVCWDITMPAGTTAFVSCLFSIPAERKVLLVAFPGANELMSLPTKPQGAALKTPEGSPPAVQAQPPSPATVPNTTIEKEAEISNRDKLLTSLRKYAKQVGPKSGKVTFSALHRYNGTIYGVAGVEGLIGDGLPLVGTSTTVFRYSDEKKRWEESETSITKEWGVPREVWNEWIP